MGMKIGDIISSKKWLILCLVFVSSGVYLNTLFNGFVFDDGDVVLGNKWIRDVRFIPDIFSSPVWAFKQGVSTNYYRPVHHVILMLDYHLFGLKPYGYHLVNVIFHTLNTLLVFFISAELFKGAEMRSADEAGRFFLFSPFLAGALFAIHPVHVEVVSWVSAIPELSFSLFYLIALYFYIKRGASSRPLVYLVLSAASFGVALFCKEMSITLLAVLFLYDLASRRPFKILEVSRYLNYIPYVLIVAVYFYIRSHILGGIAPDRQNAYLSTFQYVINIFPLLAEYLRLLFYPAGLNAFYVFHPAYSISEPKVLVSITVVLPAVLFTLYSFRLSRVIFFSLGWMFLSLAPALYLPGVGSRGSVFAERYLYLPSAGFFMASAYIALLIFRRLRGARTMRPAVITYAAVLLLITGALYLQTISRNMAWRDNYTLWKDTAGKTFDSALVYINLGSAADERGLRKEAISAYGKALQITPYSAELHNNLGILYLEEGNMEKAIESYRKALLLTSNYGDISVIHDNIGSAYLKSGLFDNAIEEYNAAIETCDREGGRASSLYNKLGVAYAQKGAFGEARKSFEAAVSIDPGNASARRNLEKLTAR